MTSGSTKLCTSGSVKSERGHGFLVAPTVHHLRAGPVFDDEVRDTTGLRVQNIEAWGSVAMNYVSRLGDWVASQSSLSRDTEEPRLPYELTYSIPP